MEKANRITGRIGAVASHASKLTTTVQSRFGYASLSPVSANPASRLPLEVVAMTWPRCRPGTVASASRTAPYSSDLSLFDGSTFGPATTVPVSLIKKTEPLRSDEFLTKSEDRPETSTHAFTTPNTCPEDCSKIGMPMLIMLDVFR